MSEEPASTRLQRGQTLHEAAREDLELYGVEELEERIAALQAEIERTQAQIDKRHATRSAADALFNFKQD
jgi:uncharacterized small protein (DUF1192 family)